MERPKTRFNKEWVRKPITVEVAKWCEENAKYYAPWKDVTNDRKALTTSQLRKFFAQIRLIETDIKGRKADIVMLKPYLAYAVGRDKKNNTRLKDFVEEMQIALDGIRQDDEHIEADFKNFISVYECIVAYHKFYGGKEN